MVAFCSPAPGRLIDRIGVRRVLLPCVAIYCFAFASLAAIHSLAALYAAYGGMESWATARRIWPGRA